tara:strand:- start:306 stop:428 length:123 start_codon:yes stop_codon:yes gene_type:complete
MNKTQFGKDLKTFVEIYKTFGEAVAVSWFLKEIDKYLTQK